MTDWTVFSILSWTTSYFTSHRIESPRLTAELLLAHSLGLQRLDLYLQYDKPMQAHELTAFKALIHRRIKREPVAYIVGEKGFYETDFQVGPGVLIPRPDTETLLEQAIHVIDQNQEQDRKRLNVLELGVGSGAVIVSLASIRPSHRYVGMDISMAAIETARRNAAENSLTNILFFKGSWIGAIRPVPLFDIIVSNPPYIPSGQIKDLDPEIRDHEPLAALDGGPDGGDCFRRILSSACQCMTPGGVLLMEMGWDQKELLTSLSKQIPGYGPPGFVKDLARHDRVVIFKKNNN